MALSVTVLSEGLVNLMESNSPNFVGFPPDVFDAAENFSAVLVDYASNIYPPSLNMYLATEAFENIYVNSSYQLGNGELIFQSAMNAFAQQLAIGMLPLFAAIAPVNPINLTSVYQAGLSGASGTICANLMAQIIHAWFLTGGAVNQNTAATIYWN